MEQGKQMGAVEAKRLVVRQLLTRNFSVAEIAETSGLSLAHVKKLKKKEAK